MPEGNGSTTRCSVRSSDSIEVTIARRRVVALTPSNGRVLVGLPMPGLDRVIDVSTQPGAVEIVLEETARSAGVAIGSVLADLRVAIREAALLSGSWMPPATAPLPMALTGVSFPLLAQAYDRGAAAPPEVPRWLEQIVSCTTVGQGARLAFGDKATKTVRRAFPAALLPLPNGAVEPSLLTLALIGRDVLQPDRLARLLRTQHVQQNETPLVDSAIIRAGRAAISTWGGARAERILIDAAQSPDGLATLLTTVTYALQLKDDGPPHPLPSNLTEMHDVHRVLMRSAPPPAVTSEPSAASDEQPPPATRRRPRRTRSVVAAATSEQPAPHRVLAARGPRLSLSHRSRLEAPAVIASLAGASVGDMTFVVPRTAGDLDYWGRLMSNCLAGFACDVDRGISFIIGVQRSRRLTYALEITSEGEVRQFNGHANRRPREADRIAVLSALVEAGVIDPRIGRNRDWLVGTRWASRQRVARTTQRSAQPEAS